MQIREATEDDIPGILKVLRASLGESSSKKTEEVWRYKHIDNPFGESLILIAVENEEIIGVRAFMRWRWQRNEEIFSAFRAVDTATHPAHQGKGIFKKLTLRALEIGKERGDHFVFNTPNSQSKPGYLKMGWKEVGQLGVQLRPLNIFNLKKQSFNFNHKGKLEECDELLKQYYDQTIKSDKLFTPKDAAYINWRYYENPIQKYSIISNSNMFIAGYLKHRNEFKEFRISEAIVGIKHKDSAKAEILKLAKDSGAQFLSISSNSEIHFKSGFKRSFGPVLTFKPINYNEEKLLNLNSWDYSLGDLELF